MNNFNWTNYNNNISLFKKLSKFNKKNKFNYIENGFYNHVRDIFCLSLILTKIKKSKEKIKVLDYGSNRLSYSNLTNKLNIRKFKFFVYDPFCKKNSKFSNPNISFFNREDGLKKKWDMVNFGSSIQYLNKLDVLKKINFYNTKVILITHTPFSLSKKYLSAQKNNKNLFQNIHSLNEILNFFKRKKFKLVFKSRNEDKYISAKSKFKTYSLNLLFLK